MRDARLLAAWAAGVDAGRVTALRGEAHPAPDRLEEAVRRRAGGLSVAHVTGRKAFWGRDFAVTTDTLAPRPETEGIVAAALERPFAWALDLGTGTGCLLVTLLAERPGARGLGTALSATALEVARANAATHGVADRAGLRRGDWWGAVAGRFDLIVSNPPYVAEEDMAALAPEVLAEPRMALSPGGDGLGAFRAIAAGLASALEPGGRVLLEVGAGQAGAVAALLRAAGLDAVRARPDMDGRERVVEAVRPRGARESAR
jgi:release factor glutamine methyltransferase